MIPIAEDFDVIRAALEQIEAAKRPEVGRTPATQPRDLCDDEETAEAYLLWCGSGL